MIKLLSNSRKDLSFHKIAMQIERSTSKLISILAVNMNESKNSRTEKHAPEPEQMFQNRKTWFRNRKQCSRIEKMIAESKQLFQNREMVTEPHLEVCWKQIVLLYLGGFLLF